MSVKVVDTTADIAKETLPFILKGLFVLGVTYYVVTTYTNRFKKMNENPNYPKSNISEAQAKARAGAIGSSISLMGNSFDTVANSLTGLNYNAFVKVYNAFGHQKGTFFSGDLDLIEWLRNQFDDYEIQQLSFLLNGAFFKNSNPVSINETRDILYLINGY
jgi:hypothetical protein